MLSGALQRNAEHEARLSNISGLVAAAGWPKFDPRFFASAQNDIARQLTTSTIPTSFQFLSLVQRVFRAGGPRRSAAALLQAEPRATPTMPRH